MRREILTAIMAVVQAKIDLAIESDHGRDTTHEYLKLNDLEKELDALLGDEVEHERDPTGSGLDFLLVNMDKILPDWFVQCIGENRSQIALVGDMHRPNPDPMKVWICQVQYKRGGLLTTGYGRTPVGAFNRAVDAAKAYHVGG